MASFPNARDIIFFDVETGGELKKRANQFNFSEFFKHSQDTSPNWLMRPEAVFHANNPLLQLHATNIPYFAAPLSSKAPLTSFIKPPSREWILEGGERVSMKVSSWAREHHLAFEGATQTEEEALLHFFEGVESKISENGIAHLGGWNVGYDIGAIERASRRYSGLSKYHGWMGRMHEAGKLNVVPAEEAMMGVALEFGQRNQAFADRYLRLDSGKTASTLEEMRSVAGWRLGNVAESSGRMNTMGVAEESLHTAFYDTLLTEDAYESWRQALADIQDSGPEAHFDSIFEEAGLLNKEGDATAEAVLERIYNNPWLDQKLENAAREGARMGEAEASIFHEIPVTEINWRRVGVAALGLAAVGLATRLAFGRRRDRQTQITGLSDNGIAADSRHKHTDFGSGWQGLDSQDRVNWKFGAMLGAGYAAYRVGAASDFAFQFQAPGVLHDAQLGLRFASRKNYSYAFNPLSTYKFIRKWTEHRGPQLTRAFGKTIAASHLASSYIPEELYFSAEKIVDESGNLTELGEHFERLFGGNANLASKAMGMPGTPGSNVKGPTGLRFVRDSKSSPWMNLEGTDFQARFVGVDRDIKNAQGEIKRTAGSKWAGSSSRWKAPLDRPSRWVPPTPRGSAWERWQQTFQNRVNARRPFDPTYGSNAAKFAGKEFEDLKFQPLFGRKAGDYLGTLRQESGIVSLNMMERMQSMLGKLGLPGIPKAGTWNSSFGLGRSLLLKFALPVAAGVFAADYLDYKTDHRLFGSIFGIGPKMRIAHAEATDRIPGARKASDWYDEHVPGPWYGPAMLPFIGLGLGKGSAKLATWMTPGFAAGTAKTVIQKWGRYGAIAGLAAMLPFVPGMLGSRQTAQELRDVYSGREPVTVRSGRWWDMNNTPLSGTRIKMYRPSWYARMMTRPERVATWGSEQAYWENHPLLHPIKWLKNPYKIEEINYESRPYPMSSPAGSNIPLIGPVVAATVGRLLKPPKRMHEEEWDGSQYTLFSPRVEPRGPQAIANPTPKEEFRSISELARRESEIAAEFVGLPGWAAKTLTNRLVNKTAFGQEVFYEGSRQMSSWARKYYDQELGSGTAPLPDLASYEGSLETETYTEPFRRFVQKDLKTFQANEIPNEMPHWLPGEDYMQNFRTGDPYRKIPSGSSRLPGPGYEALHPDLKGVPYDQYPTIERFRILSDVAPWSTQWFQHKSMLEKDTRGNTEARIEYEKILERAEALKKSSAEFNERRYSAPTEAFEGTIKTAGPHGIELEEMPGRRFQLSALGMKAADLSSLVLGEQNNLTKAQVARQVDQRYGRLQERLSGLVGSKARLVVPQGTEEHALEERAVVFVKDQNVNQQLLDEGLARKRADQSGAEFRAMSGPVGNTLGRLAEATAFEGDASYLNPMHWIASGKHSKLWQERTALEQYKHHEIYGSRMQKWEAPVKDIVKPWMRGMFYRVTGTSKVPPQVKERRDLDSLADYLTYLRGLNSYTNKSTRSAIGADVLGSEAFLRSTLSGRDKYYFEPFLEENNDRKRQEILNTVPEAFGRILQGQWVKRDMQIAQAEGAEVPNVSEGGRLKVDQEYNAFKRARGEGETKLNYGDWERSKEISQFFFRRNIRLPDSPDSPVFDPNIDYQDVKAKIVQEEGMDLHDYNLFDDRGATLWRKPYIDGAVRELTTGNDRTPEQLRSTIEQMILAKAKKGGKNDVRMISQAASLNRTDVTVSVNYDADQDILDDVRRHPDAYQEQE